MKEHNMMKSKKFGGSELETCGPFYHTGNLRLKKKKFACAKKGKTFVLHISLYFLFLLFLFKFISTIYMREKQRMTICLSLLAFEQLWY